jgi:predicted nucleic acid-binding protein
MAFPRPTAPQAVAQRAKSAIRGKLGPRLRDADDDMVLEAAANGRADAIATINTRDFAGVASEFGIAVLTPAEILRRL